MTGWISLRVNTPLGPVMVSCLSLKIFFNLYKLQYFYLFVFFLQSISTGTVAFHLTVILSDQMDLPTATVKVLLVYLQREVGDGYYVYKMKWEINRPNG